MANSRSNIYPVQLQGAELNLNKLDAEIKQYSGFNKNNSPFVGGCLSNIFTKEQQIEGGNADNVYIDANGDVYQVTTEGLFKNGEKLIDYTGKKFYDVVDCDIQFPGNTVYVDSEECYITLSYKRGTGNENLAMEWQLHIFNPFTEEWDFLNMTDLNTVAQSLDIQFYTRACKGETSLITFVTWNHKGTSSSKLLVFKTSDEGTSLTDSVNLGASANNNIILHLEKNDNESEGVISVFSNRADTVVINDYSFNMAGELTSIGSSTQNYFVAETKLYKSKRTGTLVQYEEVLWDYRYHNSAFVTSNTKTVNYGISGGRSVLSSSVNISNKKPFGFLLTETVNVDNNSYESFGLCDFVTPAISKDSNGLVINTGALAGDYVLYNNRIVSGICLPGGYVLASEWNSVEESNIYVQKYKSDYAGVYVPSPCDVIYKTGDKWVKLIESTPKLKFANNQIIVNVNHYFNSYDVVRNKKLLFAPAWNNRAPGAYSNSKTVPISDMSNGKYIATAINEYNLADNASLLLNPVPILYLAWFTDSYKTVRQNNIYVDVYLGEAEVLYSKSMLIQEPDVGFHQFRFDELIDLPFPSDTSGNVAYSPSLFAEFFSSFGNDVFVKEGNSSYQLSKYDNQLIMSYYLGTLIEGLSAVFILQGMYYGVINDQIFSLQFSNGVVSYQSSVVSVKNLQFVGNTPYEALFFSKTNRCLYSFTGANVLTQRQLVDKISEVKNYLYNPATQTVFLITDIGVLFYGLFGQFLLEYTNITNIFLLNNGIVLSDNNGNYRYIKYYLDEDDTGYTKENIRLETCFYGMNNQTITINDCLYFRIFSEEHEEGDLKVSATTISLEGRKTEETTFKIKASDWDAITHTIYLRYQPKEQRGLGVSFSIDSPFKIASLSVGSQADAILVDKVSKGAINAPQITSNNAEW